MDLGFKNSQQDVDVPYAALIRAVSKLKLFEGLNPKLATLAVS